MKALIKNSIIIQVSKEQFDVHPDYSWIDCPDDCSTAWTFNNGQFIPPVQEPEFKDAQPVRDAMLKAMWEFCDKGDKSHMDAIKSQIEDAKL